MNKVINGKRYNTETAEQVGEFWNQVPYGDLEYMAEYLFRKRTGEYFLWGVGGAHTGYARRDSLNGWTLSEKIIPLSEAEAREWAEMVLDGDSYAAIFGEVQK